LHFDSRVMSRLGATARADGENANAAIDGDPNTFWSVGVPSRNRNAAPPARRPHVLTVSFPQAVAMSGLTVMPRQNDRDHAGDVRGFEVQASAGGTNWERIAQGELASSFNPKTILFSKIVTAKEIKFSSLSGFGNDPVTAIAEIAVRYAGPKLSESSGGEIHYQRVRSTSVDVDEGSSSTNKP
ncbi:MAG TPA: discoidin domain-containing protein, partial [Verrucomicrobiae bacterium]|nr:discoidin domain-containing protein [Verrucomicrobiae bacterium]